MCPRLTRIKFPTTIKNAKKQKQKITSLCCKHQSRAENYRELLRLNSPQQEVAWSISKHPEKAVCKLMTSCAFFYRKHNKALGTSFDKVTRRRHACSATCGPWCGRGRRHLPLWEGEAPGSTAPQHTCTACIWGTRRTPVRACGLLTTHASAESTFQSRAQGKQGTGCDGAEEAPWQGLGEQSWWKGRGAMERRSQSTEASSRPTTQPRRRTTWGQ